nr:flagellar biosynthesis repressor FlbT [Brevundimonas diminuta]
MSLLIWLKPGEEVMVNGARIENPHSHKIRLLFNNEVRVLRERDRFDLPEEASSAERLYYEAMLLSGGDVEGCETHLRDTIQAYRPPAAFSRAAVCATEESLKRIRACVEAKQFYAAMTEARSLIALESPGHRLLPRKA